MKKNLSLNGLKLTLFLVLLLTTGKKAYSQDSSLQNAVLAYILPDSLEVPLKEKGPITIARAMIKSNSLRGAFTKLNVVSL